MLSETNPRNSAKWRPTTTFAAEAGKVGGDVRHLEDAKIAVGDDKLATEHV